MGANQYLNSQAPTSAALQAALSLTHNLPHLCGLGGDAIIVQKNGARVTTYNGTGKTWAHQHRNSYRDKGLSTIPRRGVHSTMVYGCPSAYDEFVRRNAIDLPKMIGQLIQDDFSHGLQLTPNITKIYRTAEKEIDRHCRFQHWQQSLIGQLCLSANYGQTLIEIGVKGFKTLYDGDLANKVHTTIHDADPHLVEERDLAHFKSNPTETRRTRFLDSLVTAHGANSPWKELFLLLKVYETAAKSDKTLSAEQVCYAAGLVCRYAADRSPASSSEEALKATAQRICDEARGSFLMNPIPHDARQAHTVFLACASACGQLIGITNSIFTPLGALVEIGDSGIMLSNRCYAFNHCAPESFRPGEPVDHTNNCVVVETDDYEFVIGTSGGPVQSQTLALILNRIVAEQASVFDAVNAPRHANMGMHPKTKQVCYLCEGAPPSTRFSSIEGRSDKLGIVQVAGINKRNGMPFAVADSRGQGVALGL